jgi:hypothetical protein
MNTSHSNIILRFTPFQPPGYTDIIDEPIVLQVDDPDGKSGSDLVEDCSYTVKECMDHLEQWAYCRWHVKAKAKKLLYGVKRTSGFANDRWQFDTRCRAFHVEPDKEFCPGNLTKATAMTCVCNKLKELYFNYGDTFGKKTT